jgi:hypothetical protein
VGINRCPEHGDQTGPLCCRHVIDAVRARSGLTSPIVPFELDFMDDGTLILDLALCASCAATSQLQPRSRVSGRLWETGSEGGTYPWVAPTCHICVNALNKTLLQGLSTL